MNYPDYDPASPITPLTAEELNALDMLLHRLPADGTMTLDGLDGFLTALVVGPCDLLKQLPSDQWLPMVWGGDVESGNAEPAPAPFASKRQKKSTVVLVLRHLRHVSHQIQHDTPQWEPIFSVAEQGASEWADARDWCTGFLQAVDLLPSAWDAVWDDAELGPAMAPLLALGGGLESTNAASMQAESNKADNDLGEDAAQDLDDPAVCDNLSRSVPDAVLMLLARHSSPVAAA